MNLVGRETNSNQMNKNLRVTKEKIYIYTQKNGSIKKRASFIDLIRIPETVRQISTVIQIYFKSFQALEMCGFV